MFVSMSVSTIVTFIISCNNYCYIAVYLSTITIDALNKYKSSIEKAYKDQLWLSKLFPLFKT